MRLGTFGWEMWALIGIVLVVGIVIGIVVDASLASGGCFP